MSRQLLALSRCRARSDCGQIGKFLEARNVGAHGKWSERSNGRLSESGSENSIDVKDQSFYNAAVSDYNHPGDQ